MRRPALLAALAALAACEPGAAPPATDPGITAQALLEHVKVLADDSLLGRGPGGPGEEKTVRYLIDRFTAAGLEPGNPDGTWTQPVGLIGFTATPVASYTAGGKVVPLRFREDYVAGTRRQTPRVDVVNSEIVFVGYGVTAPEYGWDDFKDVDVKGKTVVILVNDPQVKEAADTTRFVDSLFRGRAMTYYGRWTYKYEEATRRGAAAAIIVHRTETAGYPWTTVASSWGGENMDVTHADGNMGRVAVEAWITGERARELFRAAGQDFDALSARAARRDFRPVTLAASATFSIANATRTITSSNVIAKLTGSDPGLAGEYVIFTAHWDHFGIVPPVDGDSIANGAHDNATGTAALLELAAAFARGERPKRTLLFLAVTAEERGLLGARYYAQNPLYPLAKTLANVNIDMTAVWGPTKDLIAVGKGNTTLEDVLETVATERGRVIVGDAEPEKGFYYRSDHFEFAKQGVPALYPERGLDNIGKPAGFGAEKRKAYEATDYHAPSDEIKPDWDLTGAVQDLGLLFETARRVANDPVWPTWKPGTEFKAIREKALGTP